LHSSSRFANPFIKPSDSDLEDEDEDEYDEDDEDPAAWFVDQEDDGRKVRKTNLYASSEN
jgi:hypothetical protein